MYIYIYIYYLLSSYIHIYAAFSVLINPVTGWF